MFIFLIMLCTTSNIFTAHLLTFQSPAILNAKTVEQAQPLIDQGELNKLDYCYKYLLLENALEPDSSPKLLSLYVSHGLAPMALTSAAGYTLLMDLAICTRRNNLVEKAAALCTHLSPEQIREFIFKKNNDRKTVFNLIESQIKFYTKFQYLLPNGSDILAQTYKFNDFLEDLIKPPISNTIMRNDYSEPRTA